ncbi:MAG: DUF1990 domain-containing protein [Planctomycetaceae bacterium]
MFLLRRPDARRIAQLIDKSQQAPFSYPSVGMTWEGGAPPGFQLDHNRVLLGHGEATYLAAVAALMNWEHYRFDWVELFRPPTPPAESQVIATLIYGLGLWALNPCRIVYLREESSPITRTAFAYGTLPAHVEGGEERFQVEWRPEDDTVWYDLLAFSRPQHWFARLGTPYVRYKQRQFARDSLSLMSAAVQRRLADLFAPNL